MKRNLAGLLIFCLILGASLSSVHAQKGDDAALRKEVQKLLDGVADMFDKKDIDGLVNSVIPGAVIRYANGTEATIEEWKAATLKEFAGISKMKSRFIVEGARSSGDTIIATYKEFHAWAKSGEKGRKYRNVSRWNITLARTPQGLKAAHFVEYYEKATRDGRPLKPQKSAK